jgi:hypothetical protein
MTTQYINKVGVISLGKILGAVYAILGLIIGALMSLSYIIMGSMFGKIIIVALIFNVITGIVGGLEVEIE